MCALVTGVQTCALPICRAQALLVQAEGGAQAGATGADDEHFVLVFGDLVGVGHRGSRVARSGRAVRELLVCGTGRLVTAGRSWRSNTGTPARRSRTRTSPPVARSEEHTSELQSLMRISYAVFCLKKKQTPRQLTTE